MIHSLRHTVLTGLGEAGVNVFMIMRITGRSSITISQRYANPSPESPERIFERFESLNANAGRRSEAMLEATTVPATLGILPDG